LRFIVFFIAGTRDAPPANDITPIVTSRKLLGCFTFLLLLLILVPVPHTLYLAFGIHCPYGFADRAARVPNTVDTKFNLASVTKWPPFSSNGAPIPTLRALRGQHRWLGRGRRGTPKMNLIFARPVRTREESPRRRHKIKHKT